MKNFNQFMKPLYRFYRLNKWIVRTLIISLVLYNLNPLECNNEKLFLYFTPIALYISYRVFVIQDKIIYL